MNQFVILKFLYNCFIKRYLSVFQPYTVSILLAKSRSRDPLILILAFIQGVIVTESIIKCIYSECKFG